MYVHQELYLVSISFSSERKWDRSVPREYKHLFFTAATLILGPSLVLRMVLMVPKNRDFRFSKRVLENHSDSDKVVHGRNLGQM